MNAFKQWMDRYGAIGMFSWCVFFFGFDVVTGQYWLAATMAALAIIWIRPAGVQVKAASQKLAVAIAAQLFTLLMRRVALKRAPDFIIGLTSPGGAYLLRWYLTPWRRLQSRLRVRAEQRATRWNKTVARLVGLLPNLYLHKFLRDDDDRALHDHPSWAASFMLAGSYVEHTIAGGGIHRRTRFNAGNLRFLGTRHTHRIELLPAWWAEDDFDAAWELHATDPVRRAPCWTLFLFGPTIREWGFHCPERGWVPWHKFTAANNPGEVGPGCDA